MVKPGARVLLLIGLLTLPRPTAAAPIEITLPIVAGAVGGTTNQTSWGLALGADGGYAGYLVSPGTGGATGTFGLGASLQAGSLFVNGRIESSYFNPPDYEYEGMRALFALGTFQEILIRLDPFIVPSPPFPWGPGDNRFDPEDVRYVLWTGQLTCRAGASYGSRSNPIEVSFVCPPVAVAGLAGYVTNGGIPLPGGGVGPGPFSTVLLSYQLNVVPEPSTVLLFGSGLVAICARRRASKRRSD